MPNSRERIVTTAIVKQLTPNDLDEIVHVEKATWPKDWQAPAEKFAARIEKFPQGVFGIFENSDLVGVTTSMRINFKLNKIDDYHQTWDEITGNGYITTHEPDGNTLYVVSVGVQTQSQGKGCGQTLVAKQFELAKSLGCKYLMLGARLPKFRGYLKSQNINPEELSETELVQKAQAYLNLKRDDGQTQEPEIRFYERCGLNVLKLTDPNFGPDPESCNFGVIMLALI